LPVTRNGNSRNAVWNPTGTQIAVESIHQGVTGVAPGIDLIDLTSNRSRPFRLEPGLHAYPLAWLPGDMMMIGAYNQPSKPNIEEVRRIGPGLDASERLPLPVTGTAYGRTSPNGKWLAYTTSESGQWELYVVAYPGSGRVWPVSQAGYGVQPVWAKDGHSLFFLRLDGEVMAVDIGDNGPTTAIPHPVGVGKFPRGGGPNLPDWDVLADGRFVRVEDVSDQPQQVPIAVVVGSTHALRAR
jgi:hypothetical protein